MVPCLTSDCAHLKTQVTCLEASPPDNEGSNKDMDLKLADTGTFGGFSLNFLPPSPVSSINEHLGKHNLLYEGKLQDKGECFHTERAR